MQIDLCEKDLIYVLCCLNYTTYKLKFHTLDEKRFLEEYFNFDNYYEDYNNLILIHRNLSLKGNKYFYNIPDDVFFCGQRFYLTSTKKDFKFLKKKKFDIIKNIFKKNIDISKKIV